MRTSSGPQVDPDGTLSSDSTDVYYAQHDWDAFYSLCVTVSQTVARATDSDLLDIEPLAHTLDIETLETLMSTSPSSGLSVSFVYCGCTVDIDSCGRVLVHPRR
jgi:hypothetical protein